MTRGPDVTVLLLRALADDAHRSSVTLMVERQGRRPWASATFTGWRHGLTLRLGGDLDARTWLAELPEAELMVRRHLVADVAVVATRRDGDIIVAEVEVLTLDEA